MKTSINILIVASILLAPFQSCSKSEPSVVSSIDKSSSVEASTITVRKTLINRISEEFTPILSSLYTDYNANGSVFNNDLFETLALKTGYITENGISDIYGSLRSSGHTISLDEVLSKSRGYLTEKQLQIFREFLVILTDSSRKEYQLEHIYSSLGKTLPPQEHQELLYIIASIEGLYNTFTSFLIDHSIVSNSQVVLRAGRWRGWQKELEAFACSAATAGIGGIWSTMAGGVAIGLGASAIAATGIGAVIGFAGAYALSRVACP